LAWRSMCMALEELYYITVEIVNYYLRPEMIFLFDKMFWIKAKNNIFETNFFL